MKALSDIEMVRACAVAMGWRVEPFERGGPRHYGVRAGGDVVYGIGEGWMIAQWNPLENDGQAMAMVKKFRLQLQPPWARANRDWRVSAEDEKSPSGHGLDLNRAICECVANLSIARDSERGEGK